MAEARVFDAKSRNSSSMELPGPHFATEPREHVIHRAVVAELDARRNYTASTKGRSDVVGSRRKLFRQKGTGRARAGDIKPPNRVGGGTWGGPAPKPERYGKRINRKEARLAFYGALSSKAEEGNIYVLDSLEFESPSTKSAKGILEEAGAEGPVLLVLEGGEENAALSFRNLPEVTIAHPGQYGIHELLGARDVVFSRAAYEKIAGGS